MPSFTPPTFDDMPLYTPDSPSKKLYRYYPSHKTGYVVWRDRDGVWHQDTSAYHGDSTQRHYDWDGVTVTGPDSGIGNAQIVYLGGRTYVITVQAANELIAAGYGAYIEGLEPSEDIYSGGTSSSIGTDIYSGGTSVDTGDDVYWGGTS